MRDGCSLLCKLKTDEHGNQKPQTSCRHCPVQLCLHEPGFTCSHYAFDSSASVVPPLSAGCHGFDENPYFGATNVVDSIMVRPFSITIHPSMRFCLQVILLDFKVRGLQESTVLTCCLWTVHGLDAAAALFVFVYYNPVWST